MGRYIVDNGETITLERFMGSSLSNGKRFKFVSLSDHRVSDPTSSDNGSVKIKFWKERHKPACIPYEPWSDPPKPTPPWRPKPWRNMKLGLSDNTREDSNNWSYTTTTTTTNSLVGCSTGNVTANYCSVQDSTHGATVEGSHSGQQFQSVFGFETESHATVIEFKLVGPSNYVTKPKPIITKKRKKRITTKRKFCPNCGESRGSLNHKFCPYCGDRL